MSNPFDDDDPPANRYNRTSYNYKDHASVQEQCLEKQKAIEDSTTESLRLVQETLNIGADTAGELDRQGQQIDKIHGDLVEINQSVKKSEYHVRGIKSIFGALWNKAKGPPKTEERSVAPPPTIASSSTSSSSGRAEQQVRAGPLFTEEKHRLDTDRTHANLQQMGIGVANLKEMAMSMGDELERQNTKLKDVNEEADKANLGVNVLNKDIQTILKNS